MFFRIFTNPTFVLVATFAAGLSVDGFLRSMGV